MKIKEMYKEIRPVEKIFNQNINDLSDEELLAIILGVGIPNKNVLELSKEILYKKYPFRSLLTVDANELLEIDGIGKTKAARIVASFNLFSRLQKRELLKKLKFDNPSSIAKFFYNIYADVEEERVYELLLNTKLELISIELITKGLVNFSLIHPREVYKIAIKKNAYAIILVHNHPSGDTTPSVEDINITKKLKKVGKIIDIELLDHLIIGHNNYERIDNYL